MAKAKRRIAKGGLCVEEVDFSACSAIEVQFDDPGITLVIAAEPLEATDGRQVLLSFDSIEDLVDLANTVMDFLGAQEDVRISVGSEMRPG